MKITAYEVREDEKKVFESLAEKQNIEIIYTDEVLNENTIQLAQGSQGVTVLGRSKINEAILHKLKELNINYISTRTVGYDHIDVEAVRKLDMKVSNANYGPNGVADYTLMLILMSLRKYKQAMFRANVNDYSLFGLQGREMKDLTIGIMGTGRIGSQVVKNLNGFGCRILAYDTFQNDKIKDTVEYVSKEFLYKNADIISFHVPLLDSTYHMVNKESLEKMKDGVILINCARGELMDFSDVIIAIENEKIGALGLDVFENEGGIYHMDRRTDIIRNRDMAYIRQFPNVIMTQHMAFYTDVAVASMVSCGVKSLASFITEGRSENEISR